MDNFLQKRVDKALEHYQTIKSRKLWTSFNLHNDDVWVLIGPIHTNGMRERAIVTRTYYNNFNGEAEWIDQVHT